MSRGGLARAHGVKGREPKFFARQRGRRGHVVGLHFRDRS